MEGKHHDNGKDRWDLLSWAALQTAVDTLTYGADQKPNPDGTKGYGEWNWTKGIKYSKIFGSMMRHLLKAWHGVEMDPESGVEQMGHFLCCAMFLTHYMLHPDQYAEFDDRPLTHNFRPIDRDWSK